MFFTKGHPGPFKMSFTERIKRKYNKKTGDTITRKLTKSELLIKLNKHSQMDIRRFYSYIELEELEKTSKIPTEVKEVEIIPGWMNSYKGMLQVLYERCMINIDKLSSYSDKGLTINKNIDGNVKDKYQEYILQDNMKSCTDFSQEKSSMQVLFDKLSTLHENKISLLTSPKYHCEISGLGIEYAWGLSKTSFRRMPLTKK